MYTLKKSLGQHFLNDENIAKKIVAALGHCSFNNLLEVGPGGGALTKYLLQIPGIAFKAVEVDEEKVEYLLNRYPQLDNKIIHQSILEINQPFDSSFALIGNFPYNISTEILFKIIAWRNNLQCVVGMFQKEVAQRIAAKEGNKIYGITSVLTQAFFSVEYLFEVSERSFQPPPKVKSAVISLHPLPVPPDMRSEQDLFRLVKAAFNQRRKTLRNAVRDLFDKNIIAEKIFDKRAEQLSVEDFASLTFKMK
jgi:16S rRNA (adenine1518-N6/adenine1519-N6)-dimethyltransferase